MNDTLLQLKDAYVHYGGVVALDGASIAIDEGEIVALMGPNGAGKSTILKAIFGLSPLTRGEVIFHNSPIRPVPHQVVYRGIAYVPQGRQLFGSLSVRENLEVGGVIVKNKSELTRRMDEALEIFPALADKLDEPAGALSGGQQQMVAFARGLMVDPKLLLLDEPTLGLSPKLAKEVFAQIKMINERHKTAILVVEHNVQSLLQISDRAYVLAKGRVVIDEPNAQTLVAECDERLKRVFLS